MGIFDFFKKKKKPAVLNPSPEPRPAPVSPPPGPKPDPAPVTPPPAQNPEPAPVAPTSPAVKNPDPIVERAERALASSKPAPSPDRVADPAPEKIIREIVVPATKDGKKIKYHYDHVRVFTPKEFSIDYDHVIPGDEVSFVSEPTNPYDSKAVLITHPASKLGYLNKGKLYDMVNDYLKAGLPVYGHIDSMDDEENNLTVFMAFYGTTFSPKKTKPYKLTGGKGKASQEAIEFLSEGDEVTVFYDYDKEKFQVEDYAGEIIGYLPKAAEEHADDMTCFVSSVEEDDNGKSVVYVYFE